jgi:hypothetical protein
MSVEVRKPIKHLDTKMKKEECGNPFLRNLTCKECARACTNMDLKLDKIVSMIGDLFG